MNPVFHNADWQRRFDEDGYVIFDLLSCEQVNQVLENVRNTSLPDVRGYGFNVAMDNPDIKLRQTIHDFLTKIMRPHSDRLLKNRKPYSCSYMIKEPKSGLVPAHQDWSYTDESNDPSIMCWVTLEDVSIENGAMGFIPGSHHFFDYKRVFPFPYSPSPVEKHKLDLMPFLKIEPMKAGQVVFFNNKTIHGSFPNGTNKRRHAFCMSFALNDRPIFHYQLHDQNKLDEVYQYEVEDNFFVVHNNETLTRLLKENKSLKEGKYVKALSHQLPDLSKADWEKLLADKGHFQKTALKTRLETYLSN